MITAISQKKVKGNTFLKNFSLQKTLTILIISFFFSHYLNAETCRFRVMYGNDPSTEMTIGFDAKATNTNPILYYSTNPINVNNLDSYLNQKPNRVIAHHKMINCFVRLTNLLPGRTYYFVIKDNISVSEEYNFKTIANDNNTKLSIIAGGDSRNNWNIRAIANKIVSKLHADAIIFNGDFVQSSSNAVQWQQWLDDWQLTINSNNRLTPIIPARGNHENNDNVLINLFDCAPNIIYTKTLGNNLLNIYTLNSEKAINYASTQTTWLKSELAANNSIWNFVQYHRPVRPHVAEKTEGAMQYAYWVNLFYKYNVDVVLEGDSHTAKSTWPIIPCDGGFGCYEGFKRDDNNGTVYLGEGCYASPLREANDIKPWTRDSGKFFQFKWIFVGKQKMEVRTVKYDTNTKIDAIKELSVADKFTVPQNLEIWQPVNGEVVTINKPTENIPNCVLKTPVNNKMYFNLQGVQLTAEATSTSTIAKVQFYVDGKLIGTDNIPPYKHSWQPTSKGFYITSAIAQDVNGLSSALDFSYIKIGDKKNIEHTALIDITSDEYRERNNGQIDYNSYGIEICKDDVALQGLRFKEINIPKNAIIESAIIDFVAGKSYLDAANATIWCENNSKALPFKVNTNNITGRLKTTDSIEWNIADWPNLSVQKTPDLKSIVQKLVKRNNWSIESPIVFLIKGNNGTRRAKSFASVDGYGDKTLAPKLTVKFSIQDEKPGCTNNNACNFYPSATVNDGSCLLPGMACNDGDVNTINDKFDQYCNCISVIAKPGCTNNNACNFYPSATVNDGSCLLPGMACNDGDVNTINDKFDQYCNCIGLPTIQGCTNATACNFDPLATVNNDSCILPSPTCHGDCMLTVVKNITLIGLGNTAGIKWDAIQNAKYEFHYRKLGEPNFRTYTTLFPQVVLFGLNDCTTYEFAVKLVCESGLATQFSELLSYTTSACKLAGENITISDGKLLNVYPNPATTNIEIQLANGLEADVISIYNTAGHLVIDNNNINFDGAIYRTSVNHLPAGIYLVKTIKDNFTETKKLMIK